MACALLLASAAPEEAGLGPRSDDLLLAIGRWVEALALLLAMGMLLLSRLARGRAELDWVRPRIAPVGRRLIET